MSILLIIIVLSIAALETVSYPGFLLKNGHLSAYYVYAIFLLLIPFLRLPKLLSRSFYNLCIILTTSSLIILEALEASHYPNYVFTLTHINIIGLEIFVFLTTALFVSLHLPKLKYINNFLVAISIGILLSVSGRSAGRTIGFICGKLATILSAPTATYATKMEAAYPGFYTAMQSVKTIVPENGSLVIPPQGNPWEVEGNPAMVRYFLFPRKIIPSYIDKQLPDITSEETYILIAKGSWVKRGDVDYGWPKVPVKAYKLWQFRELDDPLAIDRDYNPQTDKWEWGLIKL